MKPNLNLEDEYHNKFGDSIQCKTCIHFKNVYLCRIPYDDWENYPNFVTYRCDKANLSVIKGGVIPHVEDCVSYKKKDLAYYMKEILKKEK